MTNIDSRDLLSALKTVNLRQVVTDHILGGDIYFFDTFPEDKQFFYSHISDELNVKPEQIYVVGSAKLGYSIAPGKYGRPFNNGSDIDVVIVSEEIFDAIWHKILDWTYIKRGTINKTEVELMKTYRKLVTKGFLFFPEGFGLDLDEDESFSYKDFKVKWQSATRGFSKRRDLSALHLHDVKARVYRSLEHAILYHRDGLRNFLLEELQ